MSGCDGTLREANSTDGESVDMNEEGALVNTCPNCAGPVGAGDEFCTSCGVALAAQSTAPAAPLQPAAPAPVAVAPPTPPVQPTAPAYPPSSPAVPTAPPAGSYAPGASVQPPQTAAYPGAMPPSGASARKSISGALIAGIVIAVVVGLAVLGTGGFFAWRMYAANLAPEVAAETPAPDAAATTPQEPDAATSTEPPPAAEAPASANGAPAGSEDGIVTDEQARWVVAQFEDARMAKDVERSRSFGSKAFLSGDWAEPLKDATWRPDSYEIVNSVPDLMYIHVVVSERWPSGDEFWIYSVVIDPESGEPVIDGTLDPQNVPELLPK